MPEIAEIVLRDWRRQAGGGVPTAWRYSCTAISAQYCTLSQNVPTVNSQSCPQSTAVLRKRFAATMSTLLCQQQNCLYVQSDTSTQQPRAVLKALVRIVSSFKSGHQQLRVASCYAAFVSFQYLLRPKRTPHQPTHILFKPPALPSYVFLPGRQSFGYMRLKKRHHRRTTDCCCPYCSSYCSSYCPSYPYYYYYFNCYCVIVFLIILIVFVLPFINIVFLFSVLCFLFCFLLLFLCCFFH